MRGRGTADGLYWRGERGGMQARLMILRNPGAVNQSKDAHCDHQTVGVEHCSTDDLPARLIEVRQCITLSKMVVRYIATWVKGGRFSVAGNNKKVKSVKGPWTELSGPSSLRFQISLGIWKTELQITRDTWRTGQTRVGVESARA